MLAEDEGGRLLSAGLLDGADMLPPARKALAAVVVARLPDHARARVLGGAADGTG